MNGSLNEQEKIERLSRIDRLGEILVRLNAIKLYQLTELIEEQKNKPQLKLGEIAIEKGLITKEELIKYLEIQIKAGKIVDEILNPFGQMTDEEKWQRLCQHERLGELLIKNNILKLSQLTDAIDEQKKNPEKHLGQLLIEKGLLTKEDLEKVLSLQETQNLIVKDLEKELKINNPN